MYVSCQLAKKLNSQKTIKTILEQQESLKHLIIMSEASGLTSDASYVIEGLKTIQATIIKANETKEVNIENIKTISEQVFELRKKVVETF